jgi:hypothetical protein
VPVAKLVPAEAPRKGKSTFGCMKGTFEIRGDIMKPVSPPMDWDAIKREADWVFGKGPNPRPRKRRRKPTP